MQYGRLPFRSVRLRELREELDLTQRQVAERMGVTEQRVGAIEKNELANLRLHTVERYVAACGGWLRLEAQFGGEVSWTVRLPVES